MTNTGIINYMNSMKTLPNDSRRDFGYRDKIPCVNVIAEYKDSIIVLDAEVIVSREYMIPKSKVDNYNTRELYLSIPYSTLLNFGF